MSAAGLIDAKALIGTHDVLLVTLDTLRYDVAARALERGLTPGLGAILPKGRWEKRHTPASFTYAAHHAFFAGFLPTPVGPGPHPRLFAAAFPGSETTSPRTAVLEAADIPGGLAQLGYRTLCIGGVGFFNKESALGRVLPSLFQESHWSPALGVTDPRSTEHQVDLALHRLSHLADDRRVFLFLNVSALHQPNCIFLEGATSDSPETMMHALAYADAHLARLVASMTARSPLLCVLTSDHGTAYGEDGYVGHRLSHPVVWEVPYAETVLPQRVSP